MQAAWNIAKMGVNFTDTLATCDIYKVNNGPKQTIPNEPGKTEIMRRFQLVSTVLLGSVTPASHGNYLFMAKCSDHCTKFKAVYFVSTKDKMLINVVKFVQGFVMPLELRLQHLRADGGGEVIADYYRNHCKTTVTMQQFSLPNAPEYNGLNEWDGRAIMNVAWRILN